MNKKTYFKWGRCKIEYKINDGMYLFSWNDIANALNLDATFNWATYDEVVSELYNKYDDKIFVDSFLLWFENEIGTIVKKENKNISVSEKNALTETTNIQVFNFEAKDIRVIFNNEQPLFCLYDIAKVLEFRDGNELKNSIEREFEPYRLNLYPLKTNTRGTQKFTFIKEEHLYFIMMRSRINKAKPFMQWICNEVLPSIRKTGSQVEKDTDKYLPVEQKSNLEIFTWNNSTLDYGLLNNEPVFNLNYIANFLGLTNARMSIDTNDTDYVIKIDNSVVSFAYNRNLNNRGELFLTEAGLYRLLLRSNNPNAEVFSKWVTKEVLPSIRKTGGYSTQPMTLKESLLLNLKLVEENEKLQAQIESDKPKVEFANNVSQSENEVSIGDFAKILNIKGFGEKNLFKWLRDEGYLRFNNMPYQEYINKGYFKVVEKTREDKNGRIYTYTQTLITGQGQIYFTQIIKTQGN